MKISAPGRHLLDHGFFRDADLDYAFRGVLGRAVHGSSEVGEVFATMARVRHASDWAPQWALTAQAVQKQADAARDGGHLVSARSGYLRAATYWACAVDGLSSTDQDKDLIATFHSQRRAWDGFIDCSLGAHVPCDVPYEGRTLPGYLLRPDASGAARPTIVITNGSDGAISDLWSPAAAGALARGWNAFLYDGPGQQSLLLDRGVHFRPDWEAVLTPVVDTLVGRSDVRADCLTAYGVSQGGYWVARALAFEHRFVAAVCDPGVVDVAASWTTPLSKGMINALDNGDRGAFNRDMSLAAKIPSLARKLAWRGRPYEHTDWFELYQAVRGYRLGPELAAQITTPLLVTDPENEQFWPGQSVALAELVPEASLVQFTAAEGADHHCQPLGRAITESRIFDWMEQKVAGGGRSSSDRRTLTA